MSGPVRVALRWREGLRLEAGAPGGPSITVDGEGHEGPSPMQLLLAAVGGCTGADVIDILRKGRQPVEGLEVEVSGRRRDELPRRYTQLRLVYRIRGEVDQTRAERAVSLSLEKYCSVLHSLAADLRESAEVEVRVVAGEPAGP